ncbi:MAG: hypothetical protein M1827_006513 [Pycnora praestabilis]|nr:MAG: hypothetical protein M1827_006513 [Pycnora praestabilis]
MSSAYYDVQEHILECQHIREYPRATAYEQEDVLKLAIKQYRPLDNLNPQPWDITILGAHANGFPKMKAQEVYEPLWDEILHRSKRAGFQIRGVWIADISHQGASGVINEEMMGDDPSWYDHSRDLLHMVNHFRDQMPRPLVGIGHSLGGCQLANLSLIHPRLLTTLVLLDPVIQRQATDFAGPSPGQASAFRKDIWSSRAEAANSLRKNRFYKKWDVRVLDSFLKYGLRDLPTAIYSENLASEGKDKGVTLTTTKHQEVFSYLRPNPSTVGKDGQPIRNSLTHPDFEIENGHSLPFYRPEVIRTFHNLRFLRPSVLYVFGIESPMSNLENRRDKLEVTGVDVGGSGGAKEGRVEEVVLKQVGHLVAMEDVEGCADAITSWLGKEMERWRNDEAAFRAQWNHLGKRETLMLSDQWKENLGGNPYKKRSGGQEKL